MTNFDAALKEFYTDDAVQNTVYKDNPFLALLPKNKSWEGDTLPIPITYGNPQGRSRTFATAQSNKGNSLHKKFNLTRVKDYSLFSVDNETLKASRSNRGAFMQALTTEADGALQAGTRNLAIGLYGSGSGKMGRLNNVGVATPIATLSEAEDVTNFEVGMSIVLSAADGGGAVRAGTLTVLEVDRDAGTVTFTGNIVAGVAAAAITDYMFVEGDYDLAEAGLEAWLPGTAPTAGDNFFGVDRSADPTRLAGLRIDGTGLPIEEAFVKGITRTCREGGRPSHLFTTYDKWEELENALGSKVVYNTVMSDVGIGFSGIKLASPKGPVTVIADQNCTADVAYLIQMDMWKLHSIDEPVDFITTDSLRILRETSEDGVEGRIGGYRNLGCRAPGFNARIQLD